MRKSTTEVTERQLGLISRAQAHERGLSDEAIRHRIRSGSWRRIRPGLYAVAGIELGWEHAVLGALLVVPGPAWASHTSAARLWGYAHLGGVPGSTTVEITTLLGQRARLRDVRAHRSGTLEEADLRQVGPIPVLSAARTIVDLSARVPPGELGRMIDDGLRRRVLTIPALHAVARRLPTIAPGRSPKRLAAALAERTAGYHPGDSELEHRVFDVIVTAGLPRPERQHRVVIGGRTYFLDLAYPAPAKIAIEVDGFDYHRDRTTFDADRARQNDLVNDGWTVLRFTSRSADGDIVRTVQGALFGRSSVP